MRVRRHLLWASLICTLALCAVPTGAQAAFGIKSLEVESLNADGTPDLSAGSHPFEFRVRAQMNLDSEGRPEGTLRQLAVELPAGMIGDPQAVPRCSSSQFDGQVAHCPPNTQIGIIHLKLREAGGSIGSVSDRVGPVYNLTPPLGVAAEIGISVANLNSFQEASVRTGSDYGVTVSDITVPTRLEIQGFEERIWGVPAASSHDERRGSEAAEGAAGASGVPSGILPVPFFTLPTSCDRPLTTTVTVGSVEEPLATASASAQLEGDGGIPQGLHGCDAPSFAPTISARPETAAADSPTGLHVAIRLPQSTDPTGFATAELKETTFALPAGLAVNPSAADGLGACSPAQIDLHGPGPANCPPDSKLGTVEIHTPLLDHPVPGAVYLARQGENPFGSLLALYIAVYDPISGVVVKLAGEVQPDSVTGQLTATFDENPQLPFENFELNFNGGPRASLTTPSMCGTYVTSSTMVPWTAPEGPTSHPSDSFAITQGATGGCASSESELPNSPAFEAGTAEPLAGAYSPFTLRLSRENGSQRFSALNVTLPPGLSGRLAGTAECSDAQIAQAAARSATGDGATEKASPSCPATSEIGVVNVGAGSGSPLYVQGHAYLAGPYKGAPLSMVIITPAIAGPFDLGVVVVRSALYVNPESAQITVKSDPIPTILHGVPLEVRSIAVQIAKEQFTLNPTSCESSSLTGEAISTTGSVAPLQSRFQVGGCGGLHFHPDVRLQLKGATKRSGHPKLKAVVSFPHKVEEANAASIQVGLPHSEFLDQGNLNLVCTQPELRARSCPSTSVYGHVKAYTPLFDEPLTGPVYLGVGFGYKLPALVTELNGKVRILAHGKVDTTKKKGLRTTFEFIPDAPISRIVLEMKGGKKYGLLENSENLCASQQLASARLVAHNGAVAQLHPKVTNNCGK